MSLEDWKNNGWLKEHRSSPQEIANLFAIIRRVRGQQPLGVRGVSHGRGLPH